MADTKLTALSAWTPALASLTYVVDDPSGSAVSRKATFTEIMALIRQGFTFTAGGADAGQTMAVGTIYYTDISGYSADRTYTLPATAAVGDMCGIVLTAGDTAFELLVTAASGDTLNGVAGGSEWSRVFITDESLIFLCVAANSTWVVLHDGRIPQYAKMAVSTQGDGESANTVTLPTDVGGAWTASEDNASLVDTSTGKFTMRRAGQIWAVVNLQSKDTIVDGQSWYGVILWGGSESVRGGFSASGSVANLRGSCQNLGARAVGDYMQPAFLSTAGAMGIRALASVNAWVLEQFQP